jgi:hypothetical protein
MVDQLLGIFHVLLALAVIVSLFGMSTRACWRRSSGRARSERGAPSA